MGIPQVVGNAHERPKFSCIGPISVAPADICPSVASLPQKNDVSPTLRPQATYRAEIRCKKSKLFGNQTGQDKEQAFRCFLSAKPAIPRTIAAFGRIAVVCSACAFVSGKR
jgi:hypothetical protein